MERREFIATAGTAVAVASGVGLLAQTSSKAEEMHAPKYKALEESAASCVATGEDCLRHCLAMVSMKDTSMAACTLSVIELATVCRALQTLASVNSTFTPAFAKNVGAVCDACGKECQKFYNKYAECKVCADACKKCSDDCRKVALVA